MNPYAPPNLEIADKSIDLMKSAGRIFSWLSHALLYTFLLIGSSPFWVLAQLFTHACVFLISLGSVIEDLKHGYPFRERYKDNIEVWKNLL